MAAVALIVFFIGNPESDAICGKGVTFAKGSDLEEMGKENWGSGYPRFTREMAVKIMVVLVYI